MIRFVLVLIATLFWQGGAQAADTLRLAVTTSFQNSGLADHLLPAIRRDTGITVQLLVVGTGQALKLGRSGDVDAVLTHAPAAEAAFVAAGHATHRRAIMYSDFVLIGPADDPAGIADATTAAQAAARIAATAGPFVSRGDDSGTHAKERAVWRAAGLSPQGFGRGYVSVGAGMGAALNTAVGLGAYILSDRASWLNFGNKGDLTLLYGGDPTLFNQYAFLPVNPARHPHIRHQQVARLERWLTSEGARHLIDGFAIAGTHPFVFNAR